MIFNNSVTVYHECTSGFKRSYYVRASVFEKEKLVTQAGTRVEKNELSIRVFTDSKTQISAGDRLVLGYCDAENPPEDSYLILNSTPNFMGTRGTHHYKLYAV